MRSKGWLLSGVAVATALAIGSPLVAHAQSGISAAQAETIAQQAVGSGSQAYHASADHQGATAVWDVHVRNAAGVAYDVKVAVATGAVLSDRLAGDANAASHHASGSTTATGGGTAVTGGGTAVTGTGTTTTGSLVTTVGSKDHAEASGTEAHKAKTPDVAETASAVKAGRPGTFLGTPVTLGVKLSQPPAPLAQDAAAGQAALAARLGGPKTLKWVKLEQKKSDWLFTVKVRGGKDKIWLATTTGAVVRSKVQVSS